MKNKFAWYLNASPETAQQLWNTAILTVDANVLLDLYRYHSATRDSILAAIEAFSPRVWISNQAASEFFANRKTVIASAEKTFREANAAVDEFVKSLDSNSTKLRGYRLVPRQVTDGLESQLAATLGQARAQIKEASEKHPNYLKEDEILTRILSIFDGRVGDADASKDHSKLIQEAEQRFKAKVPPGYMDTDKDGDRKYGDFIFWSQTMRYAKAAKVPFILVTSEQKEDWWEKSSGKTLGPRMELIQEFASTAEQPIFIYQTDHFLEVSAKRTGAQVTSDVVEEIKQVSAQRTRQYRNPPAVDVEQLTQTALADENHGTLEIDLLREVFMMTGTGHFDPQMTSVPIVAAEVISAPTGCPPFEVAVKTGTTFDFNVHIRSASEERLPIGHYSVRYEAVC